jgi:hypothetical protein
MKGINIACSRKSWKDKLHLEGSGTGTKPTPSELLLLSSLFIIISGGGGGGSSSSSSSTSIYSINMLINIL